MSSLQRFYKNLVEISRADPENFGWSHKPDEMKESALAQSHIRTWKSELKRYKPGEVFRKSQKLNGRQKTKR